MASGGANRDHRYVKNQIQAQNRSALGRGAIVFARRRGGSDTSDTSDIIVKEIRRGEDILYHVGQQSFNLGFSEDLLACIHQAAAEHSGVIGTKINKKGHASFWCDISEAPDGYRIKVSKIKWSG